MDEWFDVDAALKALLVAADAAGIDRSRLVLGIVGDDTPDGGFEYETFVGETEAPSVGLRLDMVSRSVAEIAADQRLKLDQPVTCPSCESLRFGKECVGGAGYRLRFRRRCLSCGHEEPAT